MNRKVSRRISGCAKALIGASIAFICGLDSLPADEAKSPAPTERIDVFDLLGSPGFRVGGGNRNASVRKEMADDSPYVSVELKYDNPDANAVYIQLYFDKSIGMLTSPSGVLRSACLDFRIRQSKKFNKEAELRPSLLVRDKTEAYVGGSGFNLPITSDWSSARVKFDPRILPKVHDGGSFLIKLTKDQLKEAKIDPNSWFEIKDVHLSTNAVELPGGAEGIRSRNVLDAILAAKPVPSPDSTIDSGAKEGIGAGLIVDLKKGGSIKAEGLSIPVPATPVEGKLYGVSYLLVEMTEKDPDFKNRLEKNIERGDLLTFLFEGAYGMRIEAVQGAPLSIRDTRNKVRVATVDYPQTVEGKKVRATIRRYVLPVQVPTGFELKAVTISADQNAGSLAHLHYISFHTLEEAAAMKLNDPSTCGQWSATDGIPPKE